MAFAQNREHLALADTQEIFTEDDSQSLYPAPTLTSMWAKLLYIPDTKISVGKFCLIARKQQTLVDLCFCCCFLRTTI